MPRPPARRTRTVRQASGDIPKKQPKKNTDDTQSNAATSKSNRVSTPPRPSHESDSGNNHKNPELTPARNVSEDAIASSPAENNTTTTSIRPPTRARGYSSTLSLGGRKGDFNSRIGSTPGFESSILSNFKRRARQPSLLQMMQAEDDDESNLEDDDDFLGGLSSPQDESTPLNVARTGAAPIVDDQLVAVSPSRPPAVSTPSSRESRKRKRQPGNEDIGLASSPSSSLSTLTRTPGTPSVRRSAESPSITMATPLSSESTSPARLLSLGSHAKQTVIVDKAADLLPKVTTLNIQSKFLPQRRVRRRQQPDDSDDADSAHEDPDEDELTREVMRRPQRLRRRGLSEAPSRNANAKGNRKNKDSGKGSSSGKAQPRTYSRQKLQASDKENRDLDEDSSVLSSPPPSEDLNDTELEIPSRKKTRITSRELREQALKFAEVDKWQMEFEEVSCSEASPSR